MRDRVLADIEETIHTINIEQLYAKKRRLTELSFEKWSLMEMRDLILQKPDTSPRAIVEEFMDFMNPYTSDGPRNHLAFCIAYDTAFEVLTELIGGEPQY